MQYILFGERTNVSVIPVMSSVRSEKAEKYSTGGKLND